MMIRGRSAAALAAGLLAIGSPGCGSDSTPTRTTAVTTAVATDPAETTTPEPVETAAAVDTATPSAAPTATPTPTPVAPDGRVAGIVRTKTGVPVGHLGFELYPNGMNSHGVYTRTDAAGVYVSTLCGGSSCSDIRAYIERVTSPGDVLPDCYTPLLDSRSGSARVGDRADGGRIDWVVRPGPCDEYANENLP
jgi:hypothetical protein